MQQNSLDEYRTKRVGLNPLSVLRETKHDRGQLKNKRTIDRFGKSVEYRMERMKNAM